MDAYTGEIRIFAGNYAPYQWAFCEGQELNIRDYTKLFAVLGVQFGGNGTTTFHLPDMRGRAPISQGTGPGLSFREVGETGGSASVTLTTAEIPAHTHIPNFEESGNQTNPAASKWANPGKRSNQTYNGSGETEMSPLAIGSTGGSQPHNNMQPYVEMKYIICLQGIAPNRP
ncbi:phage tail protein [Paenibacillus sp. NEAU-GSW1]|uniref:phage tail protein n=1 Tax=Paenibacillus sp. NEAU-GSW1 TaxID=2682486 RepID=UPI0012E2EA5F|nr:tail fiber protein [Paenibacillus sp. NEAU-GSW1]MUT64594.1 phage tail protein [Paenibacillus sp. NEAU-GSW1]